MRIIKLALISFLFFFLILTGFSLFIPANIRLTKVINIGGETDSIFSLIKNKEQWKRWHPVFTGTGGAGQSALESIELRTVSESDSLLNMQWLQKGKRTMYTGWQLHRSNPQDSATLQWYMDFHLSWYPWQKFGSLFYENNYGRMMEQGLYNLKREVEKKDGPL